MAAGFQVRLLTNLLCTCGVVFCLSDETGQTAQLARDLVHHRGLQALLIVRELAGTAKGQATHCISLIGVKESPITTGPQHSLHANIKGSCCQLKIYFQRTRSGRARARKHAPSAPRRARAHRCRPRMPRAAPPRRMAMRPKPPPAPAPLPRSTAAGIAARPERSN